MLDDIRVLDVTQVVSGSFASMTLADMGAEVIKVENPEDGDVGRQKPPFVDGVSSYFASVNRNKRAIALDLTEPRAQEVFLDLAETADVVVENFRPGTMESFGLGYETVADRNDAIVYCSITGFGQTGPYADYPALDIVVQAMSGNMSITGPPDSKPYRSGIPVADLAGSTSAVQAVLGALYVRERTGTGQYIDVSMLDSLLSWLTVRAGYTFGTGEPYPRMGNELDEFVPYGVFETSDSHLALVVVRDHHWKGLCDAIDRPDLATDDRFVDTPSRREHRAGLRAILEHELTEKTTSEWFDLMQDAGVPAGPIYDTEEVWDDDHVASRGLLSEVQVGDQPFPAIEHPVNFTANTTGVTSGVPNLGEHTREILDELGYAERAVQTLIDDGIAGGSTPDDADGS